MISLLRLRALRIKTPVTVPFFALTATTAMAAALSLSACDHATKSSADTQFSAKYAATQGAQVAALIKVDSVVGTGAIATAGKSVTVHYTGWLYDPKADQSHGKKFDSSLDHGQPFRFNLGAGQVIQGWDQGVVGMKVGGKRTLTIPYAMGYGTSGAGDDIPPYATLIFDVELLAVN